MLDCNHADVGDLDDPNNSGPLGMDYIKLYCDQEDRSVAIVFMLLAWVVFLIYVMGGTAKNYFSPTLGAICEKMKISYDVAGVNFDFTHSFILKLSLLSVHFIRLFLITFIGQSIN